MIHVLECEPDEFSDIVEGSKTYLLLEGEYNYHVGDYIALNELDDTRETYTGNFQLVRTSYIQHTYRYNKVLTVMSIKPVRVVEQ